MMITRAELRVVSYVIACASSTMRMRWLVGSLLSVLDKSVTIVSKDKCALKVIET
jgi:hypothetical protein